MMKKKEVQVSEVAINIEWFTKVENIVCGPCPVCHPPKLQHKMHTALNLTNQNDGSAPTMLMRRPWNLIHPEIGHWIAKACEPFNICERFQEWAILFWEGEDDLHLSNCQGLCKKYQKMLSHAKLKIYSPLRGCPTLEPSKSDCSLASTVSSWEGTVGVRPCASVARCTRIMSLVINVVTWGARGSQTVRHLKTGIVEVAVGALAERDEWGDDHRYWVRLEMKSAAL